MELDRMLHDAGIARTQCFVTNVARVRPKGNDITQFIPAKKSEITPDCILVRGKHVRQPIVEGIDLLRREVELVRPSVIVPVGNAALWALTGKWGITKWRSSYLNEDLVGSQATVVPTIHPAAVLREYEWRPIVVHDLKRAAGAVAQRPVRPDWRFILRPTFEDVVRTVEALIRNLERGPTKLAVDIETRAGHIACIGIAWSRTEALCIPLMDVKHRDGYWMEEEEAEIILHLARLLQHPNARVVGQNFIYDTQYIWRHWHFKPRFDRDTMLAQHAMFKGMSKGLDFLASMYADYYVYWKDESKDWDPKVGEDQLWNYNCLDAVYTYEIDDKLQALVDKMGLREHHDFKQSLFHQVLQTMSRGIRVDIHRRKEVRDELIAEIKSREEWLTEVLGHPLNVKSSKQMHTLFYGDLAQKVIIKRATGNATLDDKALATIGSRQPLLKPVIRVIQELRSLGVFLSTFVEASPGWDGRMRSSYNIAGTETDRLSSSQDAFGSGMNLQNVPKGDDPAERGPDDLILPNIRRLFVPDEGYEFFDIDLDRADLQVVVWEADDDELRAALREGVDLHALNAITLFGLQCSLAEVKTKHPSKRHLAKGWVHGTNYGGGPRTMAANCGISVHEAERLRARWFQAHPGIKRWHERTEAQLKSRRYVQNRFGGRRYYFGRIEGVLPEALAWVPQSTVAEVINRAWKRIFNEAPWIEILLQVHDSLAGQYPVERRDEARNLIPQLAQVVVPYEVPLVIPVGMKTSTLSWGDCE